MRRLSLIALFISVIFCLPAFEATFAEAQDIGEIQSLLRSASELHAKGSYAEARASFEKAFGIARLLGRASEMGQAQIGIARCCEGLKDYGGAIAHYELAVSHLENSDDKVLLASTCYSLGSVRLMQGDLVRAAQAFERSAVLYEKGGDSKRGARAYQTAGRTLRKMNESTKALKAYASSLKLAEEAGEKGAAAEALKAMGIIYSGESLEKSLCCFEKALELYEAMNDSAGVIDILQRMSAIHGLKGEYQKSRESFEKTLALAEKEGLRRQAAISMYGIGMADLSTGRFDRAREYFDKALAIYQAVAAKEGVVQVTKSMALLYQMQDNVSKEMVLREKLLEMNEEMGNREGMAEALSDISFIYSSREIYGRAIEYLNRAIKISEETGARHLTAKYLAGLSWCFAMKGNTEEALKNADKAYAICLGLESRSHAARTLDKIASAMEVVARKDGTLYQKALVFHQKALELYITIGSNPSAGGEYLSIGDIYHRLGNLSEEEKSLQESLKCFSRTADSTFQSMIYYYLGRNSEDRGDLRGAADYYYKSVDLIEELRKHYFTSEEEKAASFSKKSAVYRALLRVLLKLYEKGETPGEGEKYRVEDGSRKYIGSDYQEMAFHYSERSRARALLNMLSERQSGIYQGVSSELLQKQSRVTATLTALQKSLWNLSRGAGPSADAVALVKKRIAEEEENYDRIREEIRKSSPRYASLMYPETPSVRDARILIAPDAALLEYAVSGRELFCFIITGDRFSVCRMQVSQNKLEEMVRELYSAIRERESEDVIKSRAEVLCREAFIPCESRLAGIRRLIISSDSALNYIPFEILCKDGKYLIQDYTISYVPSVGSIGLLRKGGQKEGNFLGFGDPDFSAAGMAEGEASGENLTRGYFRSRGVMWNTLPGTRREMEGIGKTVTESRIYLGKEACEENVKRESGKYGTIHFATHGMLDDAHPLLYSALILTGADSDQAGDENDGYLRAAEVFNLPLKADMVVLSGCQTGLGANLTGEGLLGLSTAFFYAGAKSLIVSLWSVEDESTANLFYYFYQNMGSMRKAEALRQAKLRLIRENNAGPFSWAPFILLGDVSEK